MTQYSKEILSNPELLRQKLSIYLDGSKSVESYAKACEKFFEAGKGEKLKNKNTWSWKAFFSSFLGPQWFFLYRGATRSLLRVVLIMLLIFYADINGRGSPDGVLAFESLLGFIIFPLWLGNHGKFIVCQNFVERLDLGNDKELKVNKSYFYTFLVLNIFLFCLAVFMLLTSQISNFEEYFIYLDSNIAFLALMYISTILPKIIIGIIFGGIAGLLF
ncbi:MAG: hypothetical protein GX282_01685 [Campylobacteraceae bacterium]|nr:hypothetical protein [Campylobacteraceae bacterium]